MNITRSKYRITTPRNAHPELPFHLERVSFVVFTVGNTRRRGPDEIEWLGSFATRDLALGRQLIMEGRAA